MRVIAVFVAVFAIGSVPEGRLWAQEKERVGCDPSLPRNNCPGPDCACAADTLEVTFDGDTLSTSLVDHVGAKVEAVVMTETVSQQVQGWSYGVAHDDGVLTLESASLDGTDAKAEYRMGFDATRINVETCTNPTDVKCVDSRPGGGWISAVVLSLTEAAQLRVKRNSIARASYTVQALPGKEGTLISLSDRLKGPGSPPVQIAFTIGGRTRNPSKLVDGHLLKAPVECHEHAFYFGNVASDVDVQIEKDRAVSISLRSTEAVSAFSLAVRTPLAVGEPWEFAHQALGQSAERPVSVEIIDALGVSRLPARPNRAISAGQRAVRIERGSTIEVFSGHDLLVYDFTPAWGGPGFIVGYVADLGTSPDERIVIPSAPEPGCEVREVLRVIPGDVDVPFLRGDGDGSGNITILDAILAVPIGPRLPVSVDCDDAFDADDDGRQTVIDVIVIVRYLFQNGPDFPQPFASCGTDATDDPLECAEFRCP
jgi:hypothetical protein